MSSLNYSFPDEMLNPIRHAAMGFISSLKDNLVHGYQNAFFIIRGGSILNNNFLINK